MPGRAPRRPADLRPSAGPRVRRRPRGGAGAGRRHGSTGVPEAQLLRVEHGPDARDPATVDIERQHGDGGPVAPADQPRLAVDRALARAAAAPSRTSASKPLSVSAAATFSRRSAGAGSVNGGAGVVMVSPVPVGTADPDGFAVPIPTTGHPAGTSGGAAGFVERRTSAPALHEQCLVPPLHTSEYGHRPWAGLCRELVAAWRSRGVPPGGLPSGTARGRGPCRGASCGCDLHPRRLGGVCKQVAKSTPSRTQAKPAKIPLAHRAFRGGVYGRIRGGAEGTRRRSPAELLPTEGGYQACRLLASRR